MAAITSEPLSCLVFRALPGDVGIEEFKGATLAKWWVKKPNLAVKHALRKCVRLDWGAYLDANPDVQASKMDPVLHFVSNGIFEGRKLFSHPEGWQPRQERGAKVSVIVPNYNGGLYLHKCFGSLLSQTLKDVEFIIVDDASTDDSRDIIESFSTHDSRFRPIFLAENQGTHMARKAGVAAADGDYIMFLDSDDFFTPNACEVALNSIKEGYDIVCFGVNIIDNGGRSPSEVVGLSSCLNKPDKLYFTGIQIMNDYYFKLAGSCILWNKIYRSSICKIAFEQMEDGYFTGADDEYNSLVLMWYSRRLMVITDRLYYHVFGRGKASISSSPERIDIFLKRTAIIGPISRFCKKKGLDKIFHKKQINLFDFQSMSIFPYLNSNTITEYFGENIKNLGINFVLNRLIDIFFKERALIADKLVLYPSKDSKPVKNIAIFYYRLTYGGVQAIIKNLSTVLKNNAYKVFIFIAERSNYEVELGPNVSVHYVSSPMPYLKENVKSHLGELYRLLDDLQIDLFVHMFATSPELVWDVMLCRLLGIPVIGCMHSELTFDMGRPREGYMFYDQLLVMKCLDALICLSGPSESALRVLGVNAHYIPNGMPLPESAPIPPEGKPTIAFIGRLEDRYKQISHALHILHEARKTCPDLSMLCIGGFNDRKKEAEFYQLIKELGLGGFVRVTGWTDRVGNLLKQCYIMLCTSWCESFNLGMLEAQAHGLPCVTYDLPIAQIEENPSIIVVPQGDWRSAAGAIIKLVSDRGAYEKLSRIAADKARRFSQEAFSANMLNLIKNFKHFSPVRYDTLKDYRYISRWISFYAGKTGVSVDF